MQTKIKAKNQVLSSTYKTSDNFYRSDKALQHFLFSRLSASGLAYMDEPLESLGLKAAGIMNELSLMADKNGPTLRKRNFLGEKVDEVIFHPAYDQLKAIAVDSQMFRLKWQPELRSRFAGERNRLSFAAGYIYAMSESGLYCPLCMTDGVAVLIDRYCKEEDKERLLEKIYTDKPEELYTGAMFLTEKAGGSDVGANLVEAKQLKEDQWLLNGEKWFCSNASAEIIFALARTNPEISGTRGLGIFLIEPYRDPKVKDSMDLVRLKDKLGTRSMASGEYLLNDTQASLIGGETEGFKIMTDMINLSRLYNSVAAISGLRRSLIEAYQFLSHRTSFGKSALEHAMIRTKLEELGSLHMGNFYSTWKAITLLDQAESGDEQAAERLRFLTPLIKKTTAQDAVYVVREAMELMGGMGYIEDGVIPKTMRDVMVLPIWEGAGNIMILDMLRAAAKSKGLELILEDIEHYLLDAVDRDPDFNQLLTSFKALEGLISALFKENPEVMQATAKPAFEQLSRYYQLTVLLEHYDEDTQEWIEPAINYYKKLLLPSMRMIKPIAVEEIQNLMAWEY
jgi:acyl-CoA dehydrogenase